MSRALIATLGIAVAAPAFAQTGFFSAIDDVPMPAGFAEVGASSGFEAPEGRIVVAEAEGQSATLSAVRDFYYDTLPQLGWSVSPQPDGALVFQRGREQLSFTVEQQNGTTRLGARLVVAPAAMDAD
jgi:hypothetical protein